MKLTGFCRGFVVFVYCFSIAFPFLVYSFSHAFLCFPFLSFSFFFLAAATILQKALRQEMSSYLMLRAVSVLCGVGDAETACAIAEKVRQIYLFVLFGSYACSYSYSLMILGCTCPPMPYDCSHNCSYHCPPMTTPL